MAGWGFKHNGGVYQPAILKAASGGLSLVAGPGVFKGNFMTLEAVLAALHMLAILTLVVFLTSEAALCRSEWMNPAVVKRLARLDLMYCITAVVLLATGLARMYLGVKGLSWYVSQPLFHVKTTLFVLMVLLSIKPTLTFRRWLKALNQTGALPGETEVRSTRRWIMVQSHILPVVAVIAVFWARGW